jgi:hypothetical protein
MPQTKIITVYSFSELSDEAKRHAIEHDQEINDYSWQEEALQSIKALAKYFDGEVRGYSISWNDSQPSRMEFEMPNMDKDYIRRLLLDLGQYNKHTLKGLGDCKLTGYCMDESAIDGFRMAFVRDNVTDLSTLMQKAFQSWLKDCQADYEYQYSEEGFGETCDANDWTFDFHGNRITL